MKKKILYGLFLIIAIIGFYKSYGFYQNYINTGVIRIENIVYGEDFNGNLKGSVFNGNLNFTFTFTGEKQDGSIKTCTYTKNINVINGLATIDSNTMGCNFSEFKQSSIVTLNIKGDINGNGSYLDNVDYGITMQSIFRTYYSKTYFDTTIIKKNDLLNGNGIILKDKLPF